MRASSLLVAAFMIGALAAVAEAKPRRYAMIVAHSGNAGAELRPLEYADDDGARYHELFSKLADDVRLYTVLDASSQRIHPAIAKVARIPRRDEVLRGLGEVFAQMRRDAQAGHETIFYFVLVGHGHVGDGGEGNITLLDGTFSRTDMFQELLAKSPATTNHIVVDACNAYFMVHRRNGSAVGPARTTAVQTFVDREDLQRYPNTGVLLSTSSEKDTHEWAAYRAGVFSHELRSALAGAADVNGDGEIAYSEVSAFLAAANQHVASQARIEVYSRPPASDLKRPIVDLRAATFAHWLHVPAGKPLRMYLEDSRGVRYLDAHLGGKHGVVLGLTPSPHYFVRTPDGTRETKLVLAQRSRLDLDPARMTSSGLSARGAVEQSFRLHLYAEPFDADYYRGFVASQATPSVELDAPRWRPGPVDRELIDLELRRLNQRARLDGALRDRLGRNGAELVRLVEIGQLDNVLSLLRRIEQGR